MVREPGTDRPPVWRGRGMLSGGGGGKDVGEGGGGNMDGVRENDEG